MIDSEHKILVAAIRILLLVLFPYILYRLKLFEAIEIQRVKEGIAKLQVRFSPFLKLKY